MTSEVSNLHTIRGGGRVNNTQLQDFEHFIKEELLELPEGDYLDLIDLELPKPDELQLGALSPVERNYFALAQLVEQSIKDTLLEYETTATEAMAKHMREQRVPLLAAMQNHLAHLPPDTRIDMNKRAITHTALITSFEWSVRSRYNQWTRFLIVRKKFVVCAYG